MKRVRRFGVVVAVGVLMPLVPTACGSSASTPPEPPPPSSSRSDTVTLDPSCGDVGTFVLMFSSTGFAMTSKAVFPGGGEAIGRLTKNAERQTLGVNVPPGSVSGSVKWLYSDANPNLFLEAPFTIPCPAKPDGGIADAKEDAPPPVTGPTCGVALVSGLPDVAASAYNTTVAIVPPGSAGAAEADALADANTRPPGIAVGTCGDAPNPPAPTGAVDVGTSVAINDGATKLLDATRGPTNVYRGFGGAPPLVYSKVLTLLMAGGSTVTPSSVALAKFPPNVPLTSPSPSGAATVVTKGQPFTFTWTPPASTISGLYAVFSADRKICVVDPSAGTATVPAAVTSTLTTGIYGFSLYATVADKSQLGVSGTACAMRSVAVAVSGASIDVQ